jgi:type I restriction enzyme S subunit
MCANQGFKTLACGAELNAWYLLAWLRQSKDYLQSLGRGATFKEVSTKIVREIQVPVPPRAMQDTFALRLSELRGILLSQDEGCNSLTCAGTVLRSRLFAESA